MRLFPRRKNKVPRNSLSDKKVVIFRRKNKERGRIDKRRDFKIEKIEKKTALLSQRKWVFASLAIIAIAIAATAIFSSAFGMLVSLAVSLVSKLL